MIILYSCDLLDAPRIRQGQQSAIICLSLFYDTKLYFIFPTKALILKVL